MFLEEQEKTFNSNFQTWLACISHLASFSLTALNIVGEYQFFSTFSIDLLLERFSLVILDLLQKMLFCSKKNSG